MKSWFWAYLMSHQPFPKKGANLIKNTDSLKDSQVTQSTPSLEHSAGRSGLCTQAVRTDTPAWLLKASNSLGSNADTCRHSTLLSAGPPQREGAMPTEGGMGRKAEADLGHGNKARLGA